MRFILIKKERQERPKKTCTCCGEDKSLNDYYKSNSYSNRHTKKMAVCKDCTIKIFENYRKIYKKDIKKSIIETCRLLDMYFEDSVYDATMLEVVGTKNPPIRRYITKVNSMSGIKDLTFIDSKINTEIAQKEVEGEITVSSKMIEKWNEGHPIELYSQFDKFYNEIAPVYDVDNPLRKMYLIQFIKNTVLSDYYLSKGEIKKAQDYGKMAKDTADAGQLSPKEFSKISSGGLSSVSEIIKLVEQEVDIVSVMPQYQQQPKDKLDFVIWCFINYLRRLEDLPEVEYKDLWEFYNKMEEDKKNEILDFSKKIIEKDEEFEDEDDFDDGE